jgi:DNA polymerase-1
MINEVYKMKKLLLVDGSNIMFRAYYGTAYSGNLMQNSKGQYTNAVFGFVGMFNSLLSEDFTHILVAFDKSGKTFRHDEFPDYKGGRKPMPEEFRSQIELIHQSLDVLGVKQSELELIEADDIIGTYASKYYDQFDEIEIISNDKDLLQLVNDKVSLRSSKKGMQNYVSYTPEFLEESMGVKPTQITDLKGLMGDSSDNLPGIPGVGEKTAVKLLNEYETLENVIANVNEIKGKLHERISEHYESAVLCKKIATIKTDVELEFKLDDIEYQGVNEDEMMAFFEELELHSLIKRYTKKNKVETKKEFEYKIVEDVYELDDILRNHSFLVLESFGTNYHNAKALGFGIVNDKGNFYVPYEMIYSSLNLQMFLSDKEMKKYVFDVKKMSVILKQDGFVIEGVEFDLLLAAYLLNPANTKEDFRVIVSAFDYTDVSYNEEVYSKGAKYSIPEREKYSEYAARKAYAIFMLKDELLKQIEENKQLELLNDVELPLAFVLADMESTGIKVDKEKLQELNKEMSQRIEEISKEIIEDAGVEFNIASPKQLGEVLFDTLQLPHAKKTKTGYSTSNDILTKLIGYHPMIEKVIKYRMLTKLYSTYVVGLENAIMEDGRIHTIYRQAFTSTGRLSSIEPNLQNIPIRYEEGREIRKVFVPEYGYLLASDYSQIELRVLAHMAKEHVLIDAFRNNEDIHSRTAKLIFSKEEVSSLERRQAKAVNFGIIYGQSAWGLSEGININPADAKRFIDKYYETFPGIKGFMDTVVNDAIKFGYAETLYHRRRYIPELHSSVYMQKEAGKRNAMNAPIQGTAADIMKIAMVKLYQAMKDQKLQSKMLLQIHDELVFDVVEGELEVVKKLVQDVMETCVKLEVPLKVDSNVGVNLYETK